MSAADAIIIGTGVIGILNVGLIAEVAGSANALAIIGAQGVVAMAFLIWRWPEMRAAGA